MLTVKTLRAPDRELVGLCASASRMSKRSKGDDGGPADLALLSRLASAGDEHAKAVRGMMVYAEINAPRYWWVEMDTYRVGCEPLGSESTMHDNTHMSVDELVDFKGALPEGTMQSRIWMFSYQALARIYLQRRVHRLPEWAYFNKWIEGLPFAQELILDPSERRERAALSMALTAGTPMDELRAMVMKGVKLG